MTDTTYTDFVEPAIGAAWLNDANRKTYGFTSVAHMITIEGAFDGQTVPLLGYYAVGDGGGGPVYWDATSTETADDGMIFQVTGVTTGRWKRPDVGRIDVKWFGAKGGTVSVDDTDSLNAALLAGAGMPIFYGDTNDTYIVTNSYSGTGASGGTWYGCLKVYDNTRHYGFGATIKVKDSTSTSGSPLDANIFLVTENEMSVTGIKMYDLVLDLNGANNSIGVSHAGLKNFAGFFVTGDDVVINDSLFRGCTFKNSPGKTCLGLGQSNNFTTATEISGGVKVISCAFDNNGIDTADHSSIYGWCEDLIIDKCTFTLATDYTTWVNPAAVEIHGARTTMTRNKISGFYSKVAFIGCNYINDVEDVFVNKNISTTYRNGYVMFRSNTNFKEVKKVSITDNYINVTDKADGASQKTGVSVNASFGCSQILIKDNKVEKTGIAHTFYGVIIGNGDASNPIDRILVHDNYLENPTVGVYAVTSAATGNVDYIEAINNTISDATDSTPGTISKGVQINGDPANQIQEAIVRGNKIIDTRGSPVMQYGVHLKEIVSLTLETNRYKDMQTADIFLTNSTVTNFYGDEARRGPAIPTFGTWIVGARYEKSNPSVGGSNMVLSHWVCTAAGSPGTWAAQYLSTVTPAT